MGSQWPVLLPGGAIPLVVTLLDINTYTSSVKVIIMYYTYLIGWSQPKKFYYGVRFSAKAQVSDLWKTYFTSSKKVSKFREENGEPNVIQIRKIFQTKQKALDWEAKVLRRMRVHQKDEWLNIASIPEHWFRNMSEPSNKGKSMSEVQKEKISKTRISRGLGKKAASNLKPLNGDKNPMRNPDVVSVYKEKIKGRRMAMRPDGSRYWVYPDKSGEII